MTTDETRKVVDELVDTFKREGKFDKLRKDMLAKVLANDGFALITEETNQIADNILNSLSSPESKDKVRATIREQLNINLQQKIETAVFKVMGTDENIQLILDEVGVPISRHLGLEDYLKQDNDTPKNENHQVCDMEIESDSGKGVEYRSKNHKSSSDVYNNNQKTGWEKLSSEQKLRYMGQEGIDDKEEFGMSVNMKLSNSDQSLHNVKFNQATRNLDGNEFREHSPRKKMKSLTSSHVSTEFEESLRRHRKQIRDPNFAYFV
uniref:DEK_C domain-containing protein n=1 Tax=Syphacia muris TaxID=451379 RepID=A0A0N5AF88_9BILA